MADFVVELWLQGRPTPFRFTATEDDLRQFLDGRPGSAEFAQIATRFNLRMTFTREYSKSIFESVGSAALLTWEGAESITIRNELVEIVKVIDLEELPEAKQRDIGFRFDTVRARG